MSIIPEETPKLQMYAMSRNPRGICFIINNSIFENKADNRPGAEFDVEALQGLFYEELVFEVHVEQNLRSSEMRELAIEVADRDHSAFDAFVFIIMSHGNDRDIIYGVDGRYVRIEELMSEFKATKCPTLQNKPKLFIVQACRGSSRERMAPANGHSDSVPDSTLARGTCPEEADFLLAFGAAPGYVSHRDQDSGSFFIQVLVEVIRTHRHGSHLPELLQEVTRRLVERARETPPGDEIQALQVPAYSSTLRKKLYLI